jgi:hypothetical protein
MLIQKIKAPSLITTKKNNSFDKMTYSEYVEKTEYNTEILKSIVKNNDPLNLLLTKVYTYDNNPGDLHWSLLQPKWADIFPATFLGHLAITNDNNGADGIRHCNKENNFIETEYKICTIRSNNIQVGPKGGMNIPSSNKNTVPTGITSAISAAYCIHSSKNLDTKNRETYLCLTDADNKNFYFIDFWRLSGEVALASLQESDKKQRMISLAKFINYGETVNCIVPKYSWDLFELDQKRKKHPDANERKKYEKLYQALNGVK